LLVIGPSTNTASLLTNTLHEYTHYLLRTQSLSYPIWYEEGLATVLSHSDFDETRDIDNTKAIARVGRLNRHPPQGGHLAGTLTLQTIFQTRDMTQWSGRKMSQFYRQSAELVHFFMFGHRRNQPDYRQRLQTYFENRYTDIFDSLQTTNKTLTRQWQRYLEIGKLPYDTLNVAAENTILRSDDLTAMKVLIWHARAAEILNPVKAVAIYNSLLAQQPDNIQLRVDLTRVLLEVDVQRAAKVLAPALTQAPDHAAVLVQQAALMTRQCTMRADLRCTDEWHQASLLLRRALKIDPNRQDAILHLGITELYTGNPGRAVNYLRIAHQRVPWSPKVNFHLGECLRLLGSRQASMHLAQARDWAYSDTLRNLASAALTRIEDRG
jgi:tetratricopeptide (TPR) repeat protein